MNRIVLIWLTILTIQSVFTIYKLVEFHNTFKKVSFVFHANGLYVPIPLGDQYKFDEIKFYEETLSGS